MNGPTAAAPRILVIGAGGLGCPILRILAMRADLTFRVVDDDRVDVTNLHRQILFSDADVGRPKVDVLAEHPLLRGRIEPCCERFVPASAQRLSAECALICEGSDNFATKFLAGDAAQQRAIPIVHAACVRWQGTVVAVGPTGRPCYRCLFEGPPEGDAPNCAEAGILGPVAGAVGALAAGACLEFLAPAGSTRATARVAPAGTLWTFDGRTSRVRRRPFGARESCVSCMHSRAAQPEVE